MDIIVEVDSRHRISLGKVVNRAERYKVVEEPDGTIVLHPADVLTRDEQRLLAHPDVSAALQRSDAAGADDRRPWTRGTGRR